MVIWRWLSHLKKLKVSGIICKVKTSWAHPTPKIYALNIHLHVCLVLTQIILFICICSPQVGCKTEFQRFPSIEIRPDQPPPQMSCHICFVFLPDSKGNNRLLTLWAGFSVPLPPSILHCPDCQTSPSAPGRGLSPLAGASAGCVSRFCPELYPSLAAAEVRDPALHSTYGGMAEYRPEVEDSQLY